MLALSTQNQAALRLSQLAATVVICWSIGSYTHILPGNTSSASHHVSQSASGITGSLALRKGGQSSSMPEFAVLDAEDAAHYQAIFKAQSEESWNEADSLIEKVKDRRLIGHVLADRYFRSMPTLQALQDWLAVYADLPEAPALYAKASRMQGAKDAKLARPAPVAAWAGYGGFGSSDQFKPDDDETVTLSPAGRHLQGKALRALRKGDASLAVDALEAFAASDEEQLDPREQARIYARVASSLYYSGAVGEARRIADAAMRQGHPLGLWIGGLAAWEQADFEGAAAAFTVLASLPELAEWDRAAADFWAYRALRRAGENDQAYEWLRRAAEQPRTFYGFLATNLLERDHHWSWGMPSLDKVKIALLSSRPEGARALALAQIGQHDMAETELRRLNPQGQRGMANAMLAFAEAEQMPALAMRLGRLAVSRDGESFDGALYPVPSWQPATGFRVDPALIFALMRRESLFDPAAVSVSGACGLMQLMPATAKMAESTLQQGILRAVSLTSANDNLRRRNPSSPCAGHLLDPVTNVTLGQSYVQHLAQLDAIGDNLVLLLAAYNGGPGRLSRWVEAAAEKDPLLFIESLPVRETREYVQQVLVHYWTYSARLGESQGTLEQLAHGEWPRLEPYAAARREARARQSTAPLALVASNEAQSGGKR